MTNLASNKPRRGRPPKNRDSQSDTRELLLQAGLEVLTEKGFSSVGIDVILKRVGVPKGSFYHYFASKEDFGSQLIERYNNFFTSKLLAHFSNKAIAPLERIEAFAQDAIQGMERFDYKRGCLVGNLGQEVGNLPESYRTQLVQVFESWQKSLESCLCEAQELGDLKQGSDCAELATYFWIGWEGAVLRAKLEQSSRPLEIYTSNFLQSLPT